MYRNGVGVAQDYEEAVKWYRMSAGQGVARAQYKLALMYDEGEGVTQDDQEAVNGQSGAQENKDIVATRMTSSQLAEAQKLARECVAKDYRGC
jgi:TPR repeat protein